MRLGKKRAKTGIRQRELMEQIYTLYEQKLYAAAFGILGQVQQAEDAVQDTFVKLVKYLPQITAAGDEKTKRLVMRILRSTAIDQYRKNHRESERMTAEESLEQENTLVEFPVKSVEDRELLERIFRQLPREALEVIRLRCYYGFTNRETAQILDISEDAASKRLERAKKLVESKLEEVESYEKKDNCVFSEAYRTAQGKRMV